MDGISEMWRKVLLVASSILVALLGLWIIGEVFVRSTHPYWDLSMALKYSPSLYAKHVITRERQVVHKRSNPGETIAINRWGYRGDDFQKTKPDDQVRVMVYGGSQVFSAGTGKIGWPAMVEKRFEEMGMERVEIINAGTPGHASFDSVGKLFSYGHIFDPDYVLMVNTWNDIKYFHLDGAPLSRVRPYDRTSNPRRNYLNRLDRLLGQNSQFYLWLRTKYFSLGLDPRREQDFFVPGEKAGITDSALKQFRLNVESFVNVSQSIDAEPILVQQPRLLVEGLSDRLNQKIRFNNQNLTPSSTLKAFRESDRILRTVAEKSDIEFIKTSKLNGKGEYFYDHVHLTPKGAKRLSQRIARKLSEYLEED